MHVAVDVNACNICIDMDEQVMGEGWGVGDDDDGGDEIVVWSATGCEWLQSVMLARMLTVWVTLGACWVAGTAVAGG